MEKLKLAAIALVFSAIAVFAQFPTDYKGTPYSATPVNGQPLAIPGTINLSYYDDGGEAVAYHDTDPINSGAKYGNFRPNEGVDVEIMQSGNKWADSAGKQITPGSPYAGWCVTNEWLNYTVNVQTAGEYEISGIMTSGDAAQIQRIFIIDNKDTLGKFQVPPTGNTYHNWRVYTNLFHGNLPAGKHLLKIMIKSAGDMWQFTFTLVKATPVAQGSNDGTSMTRCSSASQITRLHVLAKAFPTISKAERLFDCRGRMVPLLPR